MPHNGLCLFQARRFGRPEILNGLMIEPAAVLFVPKTHDHHPATTTFYQGHVTLEVRMSTLWINITHRSRCSVDQKREFQSLPAA
jgi:hypothetical protein